MEHMTMSTTELGVRVLIGLAILIAVIYRVLSEPYIKPNVCKPKSKAPPPLQGHDDDEHFYGGA
jgi:hypothetical protein